MASETAIEQRADRGQVFFGGGRVDQDDSVVGTNDTAFGQFGKGGERGGPFGRPGESALSPLGRDGLADGLFGDGDRDSRRFRE